MGNIFYKLGRMVGPKARKGKWLLKTLTGTDEELLQAEHEVGQDLATAIRQEVGSVEDKTLLQVLENVGDRLKARVKNKQRQFAFEIIEGQEPNAFALPGGFIFLNRALITMIHEEPDCVAFVVAHEMAHVIKGHAVDRIMSQTAFGAASQMLKVRGALADWLKQAGLQMLINAYSHDWEMEADDLGVRLALAGGYDGEGAVLLLQYLESIKQSTGLEHISHYFSTHPPSDQRIKQIRRLLKSRAKKS